MAEACYNEKNADRTISIMSKQEFVDRLRVSLSGKISPASVEDNARYYEDYINTHIRLGEPEEDVLEGLGDPRLIARSIVAAESVKTGDGDQVYGGREEETGHGERFRRVFRISSLPSWALPVLAGGILLVVLVLLGLVFRLVLHMLAWLWPVIAIAMILLFFIKLFGDWLH
jgi:Predicted membrane protein